MGSGGDESGCGKSVEAVADVSGWGRGWTEKVDCSGTESRVGDVDSVLGSGVHVPSVDSKTTSLATDGTGSGTDSFFMYGRKKYFPGLADLVHSSYKAFILTYEEI